MNAIATASLADIGSGFLQPVHGAQQTFRAVLDAMSRPGRVVDLPDEATQGLQTMDLSRGMTATLLTLLDAEVSLWIAPGAGSPAVMQHLRFHTGVREAPDAEQAAFVVATAAQATPDLWHRVHHGTDATPQEGATLLLDVPQLSHRAAAPGLPLRLSGPGVAGLHTLHVGGLGADFWLPRAGLTDALPRGVELILCCGDAIAALPRTTRVEIGG